MTLFRTVLSFKNIQEYSILNSVFKVQFIVKSFPRKTSEFSQVNVWILMVLILCFQVNICFFGKIWGLHKTILIRLDTDRVDMTTSCSPYQHGYTRIRRYRGTHSTLLKQKRKLKKEKIVNFYFLKILGQK